jgi:transcriptional regulator with XRE-family HTH domain
LPVAFVDDEREAATARVRWRDMPRRATPDPLAKAVGRRIRQLRGERRLTAERLAFESDLGSKGFLSDIEAGRASPSMRTLQRIADYLEVFLLDLFTFPDQSERQALVDRTRFLTPGVIRKLLREMPHEASTALDAPKSRGVGPAKAEPYAGTVARPGRVAETVPTATPPRARRSGGRTPVNRAKPR